MPLLMRRDLILGGAGLLTGLAPGLSLAQSLPLTPPQVEGPFYPYDLPAEYDTDLVKLRGSDAQALGRVTHVTGTIRHPDGSPIRDALVEIWQCDANGRYRHPDDHETRPADLRFQGYARSVTEADGAFHFRTIKPVSYEVTALSPPLVRAPHIHMAVSTRGVRRLTTQLYVAGDPLNDRDEELARAVDPRQRAGLIRPFVDGAAFEAGALSANYDVVVLI